MQHKVFKTLVKIKIKNILKKLKTFFLKKEILKLIWKINNIWQILKNIFRNYEIIIFIFLIVGRAELCSIVI